jgi:endonuclease/exonuclease/phosphatase family metal-dependent hydrolase
VRLATFNIKHAELRGVPAVAAVIQAASADLVGLQEVDVGCRRSACSDQPAELAQRLDMMAGFAAALPLEGGVYGNALLAVPSLVPALEVRSIALPGGGRAGEEKRVLLAASAGGLRVYVAHLDIPEGVRRFQAEAIAQAIGDARGAVLLADVNEPPDGAAVARLLAMGFRDAWLEAGAGERITAPADRPQARIDQILLGPGVPRARLARAIETDASDHALVVVEL